MTKKDFKKSLLTNVSIIARVVLATAAMVACMSLYVSSIANAALLKSDVAVEGEHILLGDLFEGIETSRNASYILGPAPAPGENLVINSGTLSKLSRAFHLNWKPETAYDQVVISRSATIIKADEILEALNNALHAEGYEDNYKVAVHNILSDAILPGSAEHSIAVKDLKVDTGSKSFRATVMMPANDPDAKHLRVVGALEYMIDVPVINRGMKRDEVIRQSDVTMVMIPEGKVTSDMILDADELIGQTPRRVLTPQQIVKTSDVTYPDIVHRGEKVTMILDNGFMKLTAMGKALEDGAKGDLVRVVNLASNRTLDALVASENQVEITQ